MRNYKKLLTTFSLAFLAAAPMAVAQDATFTIDHNAKTSELILKLGPLNLPGSMPDMPEMADMMVQPRTQVVVLPITAYLRGFTFELVDGSGRVLPAELLHHINLISLNHRELFSPIMQRVGAAGSETGALMFPRVIGVPVTRGDSLVINVMLHNPTAETYSNVEMRLRLKYTTAGIIPTIAVQPFYMDVMPPAGIHAYPLPPGESSKSWEGSPAVPGRIIAMSGHLHKYGTNLRLEDVTKNKVIWEGKPQVDSTGDVIGMPRKYFLKRLGFQLTPSHVYRLTAFYHNPTNETIEEGAMGALGGLFVPDERAKWPAVDRNNPEYLADVKVTFSSGMNGMMMMNSHH